MQVLLMCFFFITNLVENSIKILIREKKFLKVVCWMREATHSACVPLLKVKSTFGVWSFDIAVFKSKMAYKRI